MTLQDMLLAGKVNMALARTNRVSAFDVGVRVLNGHVMLTGDVDSDEERAAAEEIVRGVDGVREVNNQLTCCVGENIEKADRLVKNLIDKLEEEWNSLPDRTGLTQAAYLRWALQVLYKFHIPAGLDQGNPEDLEAVAMEQGLTTIAALTGTSKMLLGMELFRAYEAMGQQPGVAGNREPDTDGATHSGQES